MNLTASLPGSSSLIVLKYEAMGMCVCVCVCVCVETSMYYSISHLQDGIKSRKDTRPSHIILGNQFLNVQVRSL